VRGQVIRSSIITLASGNSVSLVDSSRSGLATTQTTVTSEQHGTTNRVFPEKTELDYPRPFIQLEVPEQL
jgi:hypothetical protein